MNFIKKYLLFFSMTLAGIFSAQKVDPKAKSILDETTKYYKSKKSMYFKFVYGSGKNNTIHKAETGIFYAMGNLYKLKIMGNEQIFDGKKIYNINADDMEVTVAKPNGSQVALSPINYLESYKKGYNIAYLGKKDGMNLIKMTPTQSNGVESVLIFIRPNNQIYKIEQYSSDKTVNTLRVTDYKENLNLNASAFSFNKDAYKNYLVTEL